MISATVCGEGVDSRLERENMEPSESVRREHGDDARR